MRKILSFVAAFLFAASMMADPVVLPAVLDVSNVSFRSEGMPDFVIPEGQDYAGTYFDMGAHDSSNDTLLYAEWDVTIQPIKYNLAVDVYNTNSWRVQLYLLNQAGDTVKDLRYKGSSGQKGQFSIGSLDLRDLAAGNYKLRARAATAWSAMKLKDIIFAADYQGVSVALPDTLLPAYALLSNGASVTNNAIAFAPSTANTEYATWNVSFAAAGTFNVTIDITASNGHNYGVALLSADGQTEIGAVNEGGQKGDTGIKTLGTIAVPAAGNYVVKLTNAIQWSEAVLNNIVFAVAVPEFYLVGSMNGWTPAEAYKFAVNPANDTEYMLDATLAVGDSIKVMKVLGNTQTWFPDGMDNHYTVDAAHAGAKTIYFQEAYKADWAAFGGYFYIEANPAPQQNGYVLKALADIAPTDVVIITMAKGGKVYAMSNEKGTSNPPAAVEVTVANNQIEKDTAIILWNIVKDGDNFTIAPAGNDSLKLYCTNTNNGVRVGKNANNVFSINTAYMYNNATSRFIGVYNEADWRCYTTINSNITGQTLAFYAKEGAPEPQPEPAKFYVTGDTALVADAGVDRMLAWKPNAIKSMNDTLVLNLKAGVDYQLKVTMNGTWDGENNVKGYNELSEKTPGLNDIGNDHNIGFKLNAAGPVKVIYKTAVPNDIFKLEGDFYVETMDTIPTTAPAVPTVAADDVLAIYCNHYTTNNLNFAISGWAGAYQTLNMDSMNVAFWKDMTWECVIDPAHTDDAHDLSGYKKLHVDLWAPKAAKIKFTAEAVAGANYKDGKLVDLAKGWNSFDFVVAEWPGNYDFKNVKCFVLENYSIEHTPFALANIYFYDKEVVQDGMIWKVDSTTAVAAGTTYIDNKMLKVQSVYATTLVVNERTFEDVTFTHAIQVRNAAYPTVAEPNGTENTGSTSLVITAKEDTVIYLYYNRQAKDKAFVVNDGKDMIVFDRADASQVAGEFTFVEINADTTYAKVIKKIHIAKGHAYTVSAKGTTIQLHGIKYPAPVLVPEYYLVGTMNNWTPAEAYQFAANPDAEGEYMLTTTLAVGDNFKVKGMGSIAETWYPDGMGNDYVVTEAYAGEKTIYFRPAGNQAWEAFHAGGFFYMEANPLPEGIITCDSVYRLAKNDTAALAPVTVTYLNGANVYVKDATAGMLIYLPKNTTVDWVAGDVLSNVEGVVDIYNGLYELKPDTNAMKAITKVAGEAPAPEVLNAIQPTDVSKYIKISGIEVTADTVIAASSKTSLNVLFNGDTIVLYNSFKVAQAYEVGKKYDIVGIVSIYKGTLQVCPITVEEQQIIGAPEYYLAGSMNGWAANADYKFVANPAKEGEYMLTTALAVNDEFKVIGVVGATTTWYPDGMGNNYKVDADHAGEAKTIYFRPEGGQQGWYAGYFYLEGNPLTIPTNAPAAPTAAEADVMAIYCNHYTTNNLNFAISGWAGAYQTLDIDSTMIGYWAGMTWECIIDPAHTDDAHDFSAYKKFHVDLWAPKAAKIKVTVEAVAGGNYKEGVKVDLVQGWNSFDFNVAEWPEGYEFKNVKCFVFEQYQTPAEESFEGNPFAFANLYFYDKESQGLDNTADGVKAQKYIQNGMLLIEKNGKVYTITGLQVK